LVGNVPLNIVGKIEVVLRRTNDEGFEDAEDSLKE
jgi:hypothetical protein